MLDLRRNGEFKKLDDIKENNRLYANWYYGHIYAYIGKNFPFQMGNTTSWEVDNMPPYSGLGKITIFSNASLVDQLISDKYLANSEPLIIEAANSSLGIEKSTQKHRLSLHSSDKNELIQKIVESENKKGWKNYSECEEDFLNVYKKSNGASHVNGQVMDYVILQMNDPATKEPLLIEMGNLPIGKLSRSRKIFSSVLWIPGLSVFKRDQPYVIIE